MQYLSVMFIQFSGGFCCPPAGQRCIPPAIAQAAAVREGGSRTSDACCQFVMKQMPRGSCRQVSRSPSQWRRHEGRCQSQAPAAETCPASLLHNLQAGATFVQYGITSKRVDMTTRNDEATCCFNATQRNYHAPASAPLDFASSPCRTLGCPRSPCRGAGPKLSGSLAAGCSSPARQ